MSNLISYIFDDQHSIYVFGLYLSINVILFLLVYFSRNLRKLTVSFKMLIFLLNILSLIMAVAIYDKFYFLKVLSSIILIGLSIFVFLKLESYTDRK